jgi:hypothetical protein
MRAVITTVGELVAALAAFPPQTQVQLAVAPGYPQAATIGLIACSPDDAEGDARPPATEEDRTVWISEGTSLGYLPEIARSALGQSWA